MGSPLPHGLTCDSPASQVLFVTEACWTRPADGEKKEGRKVAGSALASRDVPCVGEEDEGGRVAVAALGRGKK